MKRTHRFFSVTTLRGRAAGLYDARFGCWEGWEGWAVSSSDTDRSLKDLLVLSDSLRVLEVAFEESFGWV